MKGLNNYICVFGQMVFSVWEREEERQHQREWFWKWNETEIGQRPHKHTPRPTSIERSEQAFRHTTDTVVFFHCSLTHISQGKWQKVETKYLITERNSLDLHVKLNRTLRREYIVHNNQNNSLFFQTLLQNNASAAFLTNQLSETEWGVSDVFDFLSKASEDHRPAGSTYTWRDVFNETDQAIQTISRFMEVSVLVKPEGCTTTKTSYSTYTYIGQCNTMSKNIG